MDDLYAINAAKTEFREAFNTGDSERLIAILDPAVVYMADGLGLAIGAGTAETTRAHIRDLWARYEIQVTPIIIEIRIEGNVAYDYGWHVWKMTPRGGGAAVTKKDRYVDIWRKNEQGDWKLWMYMNNADIPMQMPAAA